MRTAEHPQDGHQAILHLAVRSSVGEHPFAVARAPQDAFLLQTIGRLSHAGVDRRGRLSERCRDFPGEKLRGQVPRAGEDGDNRAFDAIESRSNSACVESMVHDSYPASWHAVRARSAAWWENKQKRGHSPRVPGAGRRRWRRRHKFSLDQSIRARCRGPDQDRGGANARVPGQPALHFAAKSAANRQGGAGARWSSARRSSTSASTETSSARVGSSRSSSQRERLSGRRGAARRPSLSEP